MKNNIMMRLKSKWSKMIEFDREPNKEYKDKAKKQLLVIQQLVINQTKQMVLNLEKDFIKKQTILRKKEMRLKLPTYN